MMGSGWRRAVVGSILGGCWVWTCTALASDGKQDTSTPAPVLLTQAAATVLLWSGQRRAEDRIERLEAAVRGLRCVKADKCQP